MPKVFLHLDKKFHKHAGMLEHVTEAKHTELVGFYYFKLTESCVSCHQQLQVRENGWNHMELSHEYYETR